MNNDYTVELWKKDGRYKSGERLINKIRFEDWDIDELRVLMDNQYKYPYVTRIYNTWVIRKNLLTGHEFTERYDTPYFCSPSSETFWSS
jgi:hypothetical protein